MKKIEWCNCKTGFIYSYNPTLLFRIGRFFLGGQSDYVTHLGCGKYIKPINKSRRPHEKHSTMA